MTAGKLMTVEFVDLGSSTERLESVVVEDVNYNAVAPHNATHVTQVRQNLIKDMTAFTTGNAAVKASYKVEHFIVAADIATYTAKSLDTILSDAVSAAGTAGYTLSS